LWFSARWTEEIQTQSSSTLTLTEFKHTDFWQKHIPKPDNGTILDALGDVFHGSLLSKIPAHSLIILTMVSKKLKELVDTAPKELGLW
jgi:hypothetical protein